jgi:antitoxin MazE
MTTKVQKWGNSYAIRIPKYIVEELGLTTGSLVDIKRVNDTIVIRPISKKRNMKRFVL